MLASTAPLTVVILTLNEAELLPRCLAQLDWVDEVLVIDSGSTDGTQDIAHRFGATVVDQPFLGWPQQRNSGASAARNDWILQLDVDEVLDRRARESVLEALSGSPDPRDAFAFSRRDEYLGSLLPNGQSRANERRYVRLYNRTQSAWDTSVLVHEYVRVAGVTTLLPGRLLHWRHQSLRELADRINRYAELEARNELVHGSAPSVSRLLLKPAARVAWLLFVKSEWKLGSKGVIHAVMRGYADFLRSAMTYETSLGPAPIHPPGFEPDGSAQPREFPPQ